MAGSNSAFDPAAFRTAIKSAMQMGSPNAVSEKATFRWEVDRTYPQQDPSTRPYEWTSAPSTSVSKPDLVLEHVAVEFAARPAGSLDTAIGQFDTSRGVLTVLDDEYALIHDADVVLLGGNTYTIDLWGPPIGLFEVTVYQAYLTARDES